MSTNIVLNAIESLNNYNLCFLKFVSANDSGDTGGHQDGIYIPKNAIPILFETPGQKGMNKEKYAAIEWANGKISKSRFIYYGKGSRNEYRITRLGAKLTTGQLFILLKNENEYKAFLLAPEDGEKFLKQVSLDRTDTNQIFNTEDLFPLKAKKKVDSVRTKINEGIYHIRPAGRHILTIGRDLIKDNYAAIVELVKNSYDADARNVEILFSAIYIGAEKHLRIVVADDGHGMDYDTVTNKWMVPSTNDKLIRKYSPSGRLMQGRKGIGRYATAILGNQVFLETYNKKSEATTVFIDWNEFEEKEYLEDVPILIEKFNVAGPSKTVIEITGESAMLNSWTKENIDSLIIELKKLKDPRFSYTDEDEFNITLKFSDFPVEAYDNGTYQIEPFPLFDLFDYRISGTISTNGVANLTYENKSVVGIIPEKYEYQIKFQKNESSCGEVNLDIRVYDREGDSIQNLIDRGLKDTITGQALGRLEARRILNENCGIGVYRGNFRIRPYGDPGYDWLELDKARVQNPSMKIGSNQVIGFVDIQAEEESGLEEKSARDGLKEDGHYQGLKKIVSSAIVKLEQNRFQFRSRTGKGRKNQTANEIVNSLFNLSDLKTSIESEIENIEIPDEVKSKVSELFARKESENTALSETLKRKIAEYEGQVTLGKIVNVILHEGRKPFMYYTNHIPLIKLEAESLKQSFNQDTLNSVIKKVDDITFQSKILIDLFKKIDPLAAKRRDNKELFSVCEAIETTRKVFENEFGRNGISFQLDCEPDISFNGWKSDFYIVFTNLIENSIYWFSDSELDKKQISIDVTNLGGLLKINYYDNGIGIEPKFIEDSTIFEPGFSTKSGGTGLGLSIAGEAMERNNCRLKAEDVDNGVHFIVEQIHNKND
ncbi:ATP-binding protein [Prolixibacter sp. NT017]|uniref:ATP-binding protein n=1 Tax=Prolixibacter sp. NT017 TaxID=2652390 RepID=UPI00126EC611|nr:ATP-binding protein [Prolixibacter sp. NT017]GET25067.1 hypothetical protein NT017_13960 [Prolixibacter sp. NT017]